MELAGLVMEKRSYTVTVKCKVFFFLRMKFIKLKGCKEEEYAQLLISDTYIIEKDFYVLIDNYEFFIESVQYQKHKLEFNLDNLESSLDRPNQNLNSETKIEIKISEKSENINMEKEDKAKREAIVYTSQNSAYNSHRLNRLLKNNQNENRISYSKNEDFEFMTKKTKSVLIDDQLEEKNEELSELMSLRKRAKRLLFSDEEDNLIDEETPKMINKKMKLNNGNERKYSLNNKDLIAKKDSIMINNKSLVEKELANTLMNINITDKPHININDNIELFSQFLVVRKKKALAILDDDDESTESTHKIVNFKIIDKSSLNDDHEEEQKSTSSAESPKVKTIIKKGIAKTSTQNSPAKITNTNIFSDEEKFDDRKLKRLKKLVEDKRENQKNSASKGIPIKNENKVDKTCAICLSKTLL